MVNLSASVLQYNTLSSTICLKQEKYTCFGWKSCNEPSITAALQYLMKISFTWKVKHQQCEYFFFLLEVGNLTEVCSCKNNQEYKGIIHDSTFTHFWSFTFNICLSVIFFFFLHNTNRFHPYS